MEALDWHASRSQGERLPLLTLGDAYGMALAVRTSGGVTPVSAAQLAETGRDPNELVVSVLNDRGRLLPSPRVDSGLARWDADDELASTAFAGVAELAIGLGLRGNPVAVLPTSTVALVCGDEDDKALENLLNAAEAAFFGSPDFRSLRAVRFPDNGPAHDWLPREGHPLRSRFRAASSETRLREAVELHRMAPSPEANRPPLASLAALPASSGGELVATWFRGTEVTIPRVDRIILLDTDDAPFPRVELEFSTLVEAFPRVADGVSFAVKGAGDTENLRPARLWEMREMMFPTPRERAFLEARRAHQLSRSEWSLRRVPTGELLGEWDAGGLVSLRATIDDPLLLETPDGRCASVEPGLTGTSAYPRRRGQDQVSWRPSWPAIS